MPSAAKLPTGQTEIAKTANQYRLRKSVNSTGFIREQFILNHDEKSLQHRTWTGLKIMYFEGIWRANPYT
jgi:hypothetical protein